MSTPNHSATPGMPAKHATPQTAVTPRSVPSPALSRAHPVSQAVRTPQPTGFTKGGTAMVPSLSQTSMASGSSGRGQGLGILGSGGIKHEGVSPAMLGVSGVSSVAGTSNLLSFASPNAMAALDGLGMGAPGMSMGLSDMGRGKRDEDEERRRKVTNILGKLSGKEKIEAGSGMGRISDEGVRRVGRWAGFDVDIERKYQGKDWEGQRPIIIAGRNAMLIDVAFEDNAVSKVDVAFTSEDENVAAHQADAAKVLKEDLTAPVGVAAINTRLDRFASNLEALARLDKLSSANVNCVEAVTGVYASLKRLYEHEKKAAETIIGGDVKDRQQKIEDEVTCRKSGRPAMHAHRRIGLSLDYWIISQATTVPSLKPSNDTMDVDTDTDTSDSSKPLTSDIYSLEITVQPTDPTSFPPIRITKDWLTPSITKPPTLEGPDLLLPETTDWLDPPPLPDSEPQEVRFVARLHPPIVLPYAVASHLLTSTGSPAPTVDHASSYEATLLSLGDTPAVRSRAVTLPGGQEVQQRFALHVPKQELAYTLTEIPFAHPRQVVEALPVLRQWACLGRILRTAFLPVLGEDGETGPVAVVKEGGRKKIALDALLAGGDGTGDGRAVDVSLSTGAAASLGTLGGEMALMGLGMGPSLGVFFSAPGLEGKGEELKTLTLRVVPGGEVLVSGKGEGGTMEVEEGKKVEELGRALRVAGWDLGVWVEWVRGAR
ncbi:hypothetical protein K461DRAFT_173718 [Myriangium duriaei CBS 260.36]|uniref:Mediator of RNA polymerase II transcription subunit 1 n=1 Tax=Myriangium duriaei CBS 260.36 TaxID=1168546 RepID=A0A9P4IYW0_9PEZI|nr:hypothetical protein K461DRAFT_173718 [Myriangium duriaei CBS 260.36]